MFKTIVFLRAGNNPEFGSGSKNATKPTRFVFENLDAPKSSFEKYGYVFLKTCLLRIGNNPEFVSGSEKVTNPTRFVFWKTSMPPRVATPVSLIRIYKKSRIRILKNPDVLMAITCWCWPAGWRLPLSPCRPSRRVAGWVSDPPRRRPWSRRPPCCAADQSRLSRRYRWCLARASSPLGKNVVFDESINNTQ